jgi:hypothetical protein
MKQPRNKLGRWTTRPIGGVRNKKLTNILLAEIAIFIALFLILADHTFGFVASKIYPEPSIPTIELKTPEPILSVREHIESATNGQNVDVLYNLCKVESGRFDLSKEEECQQYAVGKNTNGTFDYSWYQINDVHIIGRPASNGQGIITLECVYDLYCASRWVNEQIKKGNLHIWVGAAKI